MKKALVIASIVLVVILAAGWFLMGYMNMEGNIPGQGMGRSTEGVRNASIDNGEVPLPIPPLLEDVNPAPGKAEFRLVAQKGTTEFLKGKQTETYGYNGDYLGPVIRVRKGDEVSVQVTNELEEGTTVHWHGLEVDGEQDGGPHAGIEPGASWNPVFTVEQPAATLWFHPHLMHKTGEQVYKGLAGLFYIEDEVSDRLDLPDEYGVNDVPLVIQDKDLDAKGRFEYDLSMHDVMMGLHGDTILVNGAVNPYWEVPRGLVRLRLLNGSNGRNYQFVFGDERVFYQIASDGGFLEQPVEMSNVILSPAERAEILVDFSGLEEGEVVELTDQGTPFMKFVGKGSRAEQVKVPDRLAEIPAIDPSVAVRTREFVFQGMGPHVNINGKQFEMERIDEVLKLHDTEIWEISNETRGMMGHEMAHPFHAHGVQFQVLDRDGNPPPANESGWKDTVLVYPGEKVRVIATFDRKGLFMYHCHILEHEDAGMMGQFRVE